MSININHSNINFKGAFYIPRNEIKAHSEIPTLFTQGCQHFKDVVESGDSVFVVRDQYDKRIGNYIKENNTTAVYYPLINTKSGLDNQEPKPLLDLMTNDSQVVITDRDEMFARISLQRKAPKKINVDAKLEKLFNELRLNVQNPVVIATKKSTIVRDNDKSRTIEIIMPNKSSIYAYVVPDSRNQPTEKYILSGTCDLMKKCELPKDVIKFGKVFKELKAQEKNILVY